MSLPTRVSGCLAATAVVLAAGAGRALAHGQAPAALDPVTAFTAWTVDPLACAGLLLALGGYLVAVFRVDRSHPRSRVPRRRVAAWLAGLAVIAVALQGSIDVYATSLFTVHMVQHLLLTMVAAPLLALGAPMTLVLRVASPGLRRRVILPLLHSPPVKAISFPVVTWLLFAGVMWASHFSPLFDAALEDPRVHAGEHLLFLVSAMLFWWPAVGADPTPWRIGYGGRIVYLGLGMPQNTFLALAIYSAPAVLYPHYAAVERSWGPSALADQQLAGGLMWVAGDVLFVVPLVLAVAAWLKAEEEKGARLDAQLARRRAAEERDAGRGPGVSSGVDAG
ncbi:MAG: cytochrome c oxidase assembly protein [Chloroflexota bacterium]|nr:cytochrome c oxidase assembly protein [Chloroflexota bacterium]